MREARSGQVRLARVDDLGVGEDVYEGRPAGGEGALERRAQLIGLADENAVATERLNHLPIWSLGPQLGGNGVPVEELHRVMLERPDSVFAHPPDPPDPVTGHRVELDAGEAEGP